MRSGRTRTALTAKGAWAKARLPGRAARFAQQSQSAFPDFAALSRWPVWIALDEPRQLRISVVAALLASRAVLADEIDGARLRAYAEVVGAETLEAIVGEDVSGGEGGLPPPGALTKIGRKLLAASLDTEIARLFGIVARYDPAAAELVRRAESLCRTGDCA